MHSPKTHSAGWSKLGVISALGMALLLPMAKITSLIAERQVRRDEAEAGVRETWGDPLTIGGPLLKVPFRRSVPVLDPARAPVGGQGVGSGLVLQEAYLYVLPSELDIESTVEPEVRSRGIFDAVVYTATVTVRGRFYPVKGDFDDTLGPGAEDPQWHRGRLELGISGLRGLRANPRLLWRGDEVEVEATSEPGALIAKGLTTRDLDLSALAGGEGAEFELTLVAGGSGSLTFLPLGRETEIAMTSTWPDPSFQGAFLPTSREVREDGFSARWSIASFGRSDYQTWTAGAEVQDTLRSEILDWGTGVELMLPVDFYQLTSRCTKYAVLFIGLTFAVFFLFEILGRLRIHPVQYLMVGFAMALFYLLLLAIAEHLGFDAAYLLGAAATVTLISSYCATVLRTRSRASLLAGALVGLYGLLYVLVQMHTYALLVGSIGLFAALASAMYLTRNVDWYEVGQRPIGEAAEI